MGLMGLSNIRYKAKVNGLLILKGKWVKAWLILLVIFLLDGGITALEIGYRTAFNIPLDTVGMIESGNISITPQSAAISAVFSLLSLLLVTPLEVGQIEWYWKLSDGERVSRTHESSPYTREDDGALNVSAVFAWFGSARLFAKSVLLNLNLAVRSLLWSALIFAVPCAMLGGAYYLTLGKPATDVLLIAGFLALGGFALLLGAVLLLMAVLARYFLAVYLFVEDNGRGVNAAIAESVRLTKGRRLEIVKFVLSFIGWFLLRWLTWIAAAYVDPYFNAASVVYARHLIFSGRAGQKRPEPETGAR